MGNRIFEDTITPIFKAFVLVTKPLPKSFILLHFSLCDEYEQLPGLVITTSMKLTRSDGCHA